jgi:hypothetical protein
MSNLTLYFCVPFGPKYKLFLNTIYDSVDVLWPIEDIFPREQSIKMVQTTSRKTTRIRGWNEYNVEQINWDYTGSSMKIYITSKSDTILCPIITMSQADKEKLPINDCLFNAASERFYDEIDRMIYPVAKVYSRDPYHVSTVPSSVPSSVTSIAKLPAHITKLVLADSISKNETCPISCDTISQENGLVTSCGHVFTKHAIKRWLSLPSSKSECPVCKQACCI